MRAIVAACSSIVAVTAGCSSPRTAADGETSCVSPILSITPTQVLPGQEVHAHGDWFSATCDDVLSGGARPATPSALVNLVILVTQRGRTWSVASGIAASGASNSFDTAIRLPTDLASGAAEVSVKGHGGSATVTVR